MTKETQTPATVGDISPAEYNPRTITGKRSAQLAKRMANFGDLSGITFNRRTSRLVCGHQRIKHLPSNAEITRIFSKDNTGTVATGKIGEWSYREVDWDENTEKAANIAANAAGGTFEDKALEVLVNDLNSAGFDLDLLSLDGVDAMLKGVGEIETEDVPDIPKEATTKTGDIWILGEHKILCGDSCSPKNLNTLMGGKKADMMWTDPPYGVDYTGKTKAALKIENDMSSGLPVLLAEAFAAADSEALEDGAGIYIAHPHGALSLVFGDAVRAMEWRLHETLVWVKDTMVLGHSDYHYRHEPIFLCYKAGGGRRGRGGVGWYGPNNATSVLEYPKPNRSEEHPTMKPVALVQECVTNSCKVGGIVFDPFLGSGTTLIACHQSGRKCYGIEISPNYCDVIISRWEKMTGKKAVLIANSEKQ